MKINLIVYDFDGVMTNNNVIISEDGKESVICNRNDGWAIQKIKKELDIEQLILTTESNPVVERRARKLGLQAVCGISNKILWLTRFCKIKSVLMDNVLYIGNSLNDLECMKTVGFSVAPSDAHPDIIKIADFVTERKGGEGVILEIWYSHLGRVERENLKKRDNIMNECLVCEGKEFIDRPYKGFLFGLITGEMIVYICKDCGFGAMSIPIDKQLLDNYYESDKYYADRQQEHLISQLSSLPHSRALSQYDFLASHFNFESINNILDFGAGSAVTMRTIKIRHNHVFTTAIELSKSLRLLLEACVEIDEVYKEFSSSILLQDLIIVSGVLEHLSNPIVIIEEFYDILSEGGYLFVEVPNCPYPLFYECFGSFLPHICFFTKESFIRISKKYNFELVWINSVGNHIVERSDSGIVPILKRTGLVYALCEQGNTLRVLLRKEKG